MSLKITSLELKDSRSNSIQKYEFDNEILVKQNEAILILQNILNFNFLLVEPGFESTLLLQVDNNNLKVVRNSSSKTMQFFVNDSLSNENIYTWLSNKLSLQIDPPAWESRYIDFRTLNVQSLDDLDKFFKSKDSLLQINSNLIKEKDTLNAQYEQLKAESSKGLSPDQLQKADRLRDVKNRILKIQKEVDSYQNQKEGKDDLVKKVRLLEQETSTLNEKLESVKNLIDSRKKIEIELQKISGQAHDTEGIKQKTIQETDHYLKTAYSKPISKSINDEEEKSFNLSPKKILLIIQIPITIVFTILFYLLARVELILFIGFIMIILEFINIILALKEKNNDDLKEIAPEQPQIQNIPTINSSVNVAVFIQQAWRSAYSQELNRIDQLILTNLNNKKYEEVENEKTTKEQELNKIKNQLEEFESKTLDSETYYKKRRELDILKIEKENLEFGSNFQIPNEDQLEAINQKLDEIEEKIFSIEDVKVEMPFIVVNVQESIRRMIKELSKFRQIVLINSAKT